MGFKNNIKGSVKAFICGALIANLSVGAMISANAKSSAQGATLYYSEYGYNYNATNIISTGSDSKGKYAIASTNVSGSGGQSIPPGYMGVMARIYDRNGRYIDSSNIKYNSAGVSSMSVSVTTRDITSSQAFYSEGIVEAYYGDGYRARIPGRTPNLNDYT